MTERAQFVAGIVGGFAGMAVLVGLGVWVFGGGSGGQGNSGGTSVVDNTTPVAESTSVESDSAQTTPTNQTPADPDTGSGNVVVAPAEAEAPAGEIHVSVVELAAMRKNLKKIAVGMQNTVSVTRRYPPSFPQELNASGQPFLSWRVHILPYAGEAVLYQKFHLDEPWDSPHNKALISEMPDMYRVPWISQPGHTSLHRFIGPGGLVPGGLGPEASDVTDEDTILCVAAGPMAAIPWTRPLGLKFTPDKAMFVVGQIPAEGTLVAFTSGMVLTLGPEADPATVAGLVTIAGGESVDLGELSRGVRSRLTPATGTSSGGTAADPELAQSLAEYIGSVTTALESGDGERAMKLLVQPTALGELKNRPDYAEIVKDFEQNNAPRLLTVLQALDVKDAEFVGNRATFRQSPRDLVFVHTDGKWYIQN